MSLGGLKPSAVSSDLNNAIDFGTYQINAQTLNTPFINGGGMVIVVKSNNTGAQIAQIAFRSDSAEGAYRVKWEDGWRDWKKFTCDLPSFYKDYANLSSLASALGVFKHGNEYSGDLDADMESGCYEVVPTDGNHAPTYTRGVLLNFVSSSVYYRMQFYIIEDHLYSRFCANINNWGSWHTIY